MALEHALERSQFRVTLFVGPQPETEPSESLTCVFNVKKRSWKGGIQVVVAITQAQIDTLRAIINFSPWITHALRDLSTDIRPAYDARAQELFIQAACWCKLDLALQAGITQENQGLADNVWILELQECVVRRQSFITAYVTSELDLEPSDASPA